MVRCPWKPYTASGWSCSNPPREQLRQLGQLYRRHLLPGADQVIAALQAADRQVFIVSGGLAEAVIDFGTALNVPAEPYPCCRHGLR